MQGMPHTDLPFSKGILMQTNSCSICHGKDGTLTGSRNSAQVQDACFHRPDDGLEGGIFSCLGCTCTLWFGITTYPSTLPQKGLQQQLTYVFISHTARHYGLALQHRPAAAAYRTGHAQSVWHFWVQYEIKYQTINVSSKCMVIPKLELGWPLLDRSAPYKAFVTWCVMLASSCKGTYHWGLHGCWFLWN